MQEGDPYDFASPVDILGPLAKAQCQVDDDPPVPFWEALEAKKWGLRKVGAWWLGMGGWMAARCWQHCCHFFCCMGHSRGARQRVALLLPEFNALPTLPCP